MQPTVVIVGTLDTKGEEIGYVKQLIEDTGCSTLVVDVGSSTIRGFNRTFHGSRLQPWAGLIWESWAETE